MSAPEQTDMFGGSIPLDELELRGHSLAIARKERELGHTLSADEAGALVHAARGKHRDDERCHFCSQDGTSALIALNTRRHQLEEQRAAAQGPGWTCEACGHENPGDALIYCRACAAQRDDPDPEPHVSAYDPATAPFPEGF